MVRSSSNRKKSLYLKVKMHGRNILALACFPLKRGAFQTAGFKLPGWASTTEVSQESLPPPDYLCPPEVTNWTAAVWVTLSSWMGKSWDLRSSKRQKNLTKQLLHERSTTIATKTNTNNSMDDLDRLLDEAEMVYSTATSKKKTSLKVKKEESEDSLNDDVSRYKPPPTTTVLFFFLFSESWRSSITSQQDLHNKNLCQ